MSTCLKIKRLLDSRIEQKGLTGAVSDLYTQTKILYEKLLGCSTRPLAQLPGLVSSDRYSVTPVCVCDCLVSSVRRRGTGGGMLAFYQVAFRRLGCRGAYFETCSCGK